MPNNPDMKSDEHSSPPPLLEASSGVSAPPSPAPRPPLIAISVAWHRSDVLALALLSALTGGLLILHVAGQTILPNKLPVWPDRIAAARQPIDPNTASAASLRRLPQIGEVRAEAVVQYRLQHPPRPFTRPEDLSKVRGIGPGIVQRIRSQLNLPAKGE